jgi:hypothetical protein
MLEIKNHFVNTKKSEKKIYLNWLVFFFNDKQIYFIFWIILIYYSFLQNQD